MASHCMKTLSIVVASKNTQATIRQCLDALVKQAQSDEIEIVVVDASTDDSAEIARQFKQIKVCQEDPSRLVPELWKKGIELTVGQSVAFTTANFVPAENWIAQLLAFLQSDHAAIGGVFEKLAPDSLSQWAVYFLRYSAYQPSIPSGSASQLAADNAVYRRWVFEKYADLLSDGFWEHEVNRRLKQDGYSLLLTSTLKVSMGCFTSPGEFFRQRFLHGRSFGMERVALATTPRRIFYILASPLIPIVLLTRVTRNVLKYSEHPAKFFASLPWLIFYLMGWAFGELTGYLLGATDKPKEIQ